jgi:assimilatory nitrate reductase catalytic subunit
VKVRGEIADAVRHGADDEITLITGRLLGHYQSGAQTRLVPELLAAAPEALLEVHPATAARLGLAEGAFAELESERGRLECRVRLSPGIRTDTVFLPFHFGDALVNGLVAAAADPVSGMPEFKRTRVRIRALGGLGLHSPQAAQSTSGVPAAADARTEEPA